MSDKPTTAPLLRLAADGTPEMLVLGSLEAGAARKGYAL